MNDKERQKTLLSFLEKKINFYYPYGQLNENVIHRWNVSPQSLETWEARRTW